jgi:guanylate kinase
MIEAGAFLEWARVYDDFYGTSHSSVDELISQGIDVLLDLDPQGACSIRERYEKSVHVYILPPSLQILEERLRRRDTDGESVIRMRMEKAAKEITAYQWYDYVVVNEDLEHAVRQVESIVIAERCRTARRVSDLQMRFHVSAT